MAGKAKSPASRTSAALAELVRLGERHIDAQIRASEQQDEKSRHLLTMAGAVLVAAAAIGGLATQTASWPSTSSLLRFPFAAALTFSFGFTGRAFVLLARSYVSDYQGPMKWKIGWGPAEIGQAAKEGDTLDEVHAATAWGIAGWASSNSELLVESYRLRRQAVTGLAWAGAFLAMALIYAIFIF